MHAVEIVGSGLLCGLHEELIEIGAIPVGVGNGVVRAGGYQQLASMLVGPCLAGRMQRMMVKSEAALESAGDFGMSLLPRTPFAERPDRVQVIAIAQLLEQEIGEGGSRFSNDHARMGAALDQRDRVAEAAG